METQQTPTPYPTELDVLTAWQRVERCARKGRMAAVAKLPAKARRWQSRWREAKAELEALTLARARGLVAKHGIEMTGDFPHATAFLDAVERAVAESKARGLTCACGQPAERISFGAPKCGRCLGREADEIHAPTD